MKRLLIANRGEIARRIIRTAHKLGIETVLPYVPSEKKALPIYGATKNVLIPPGGYLNSRRMVEVAVTAGAEAIHPGYGFLSERAEFAEKAEAAGLIFVGPTPYQMRELGEKSLARLRAKVLGVPLATGYDGAAQGEETLIAESKRIGFPLLIKAAAGGGGRGMRLVREKGSFNSELASAKREALNAFGDDKILLERFFENGRHIEVQVVGDGTGEVRHLCERDCTIQRRYQKILEEAPAPGISQKLREKLYEAALKICSSVKLRGLSTVEFLVSPTSGEFIFLEVNCRLQVEHPVTEEILALDLVEVQLRIARGEKLSQILENLTLRGAAIEVRVVAEDPLKDHRPSLGKIYRLSLPTDIAKEIRVEHALYEKMTVTGEFDSLLAKVIGVGATREKAVQNLEIALSEFRVDGISTNVSLLRNLLEEPEFLTGIPSLAALTAATDRLNKPDISVAERAVIARMIQHSLPGARPLRMMGTRVPVEEKYEVFISGEKFDVAVKVIELPKKKRQIIVNGEFYKEDPATVFTSCRIISDNLIGVREFLAEVREKFDRPPRDKASATLNAEVFSPLPGRVISVLAIEGMPVKEGETLVSIESMKMEHAVRCPANATVEKVHVTVGENVSGHQLLIELKFLQYEKF